MKEPDVQAIGPVKLLASSPADAAAELTGMARDGTATGTHVHLVNAYSIALADHDADYRHALAGGALNFPDGRPLAWVSALRGNDPKLRQVRGPTLFTDVLRLGEPAGLRHYLLGGTPEVLETLIAELPRRYPGIRIVGWESPPFRPLTPAERTCQDERIRCSGADIVWVGLGTPKQDHEAARLATAVSALPVAIGAAFDFAAGAKPEAPAWITGAGLEWLFRLATEPRRLWRRYLIGNVLFIYAAARRAHAT